MDEDITLIYCSFCDKSNREVNQLIAGPAVFICDDCVGLAAEIIEEKKAMQKSTLQSSADRELELYKEEVFVLRRQLSRIGLALDLAKHDLMDRESEVLDLTAENTGLRNEIDELKKELGYKQCFIDNLMLEYCPDDMTEEQLRVWASHQRVSR